MSGQGPYYGQALWFKYRHPEKIASAQERYVKEMERVIGVLDRVLEGKSYLVGDKCTYADLAFFPWTWAHPMVFQDDKVDIEKDYPHYHAWIERVAARPTVKKIVEDRQKAIEQEKASL